jgi:hypothetical protein
MLLKPGNGILKHRMEKNFFLLEHGHGILVPEKAENF